MKFLVDSLITSTQRQIQFAGSKIITNTLVIDDFDPLIFALIYRDTLLAHPKQEKAPDSKFDINSLNGEA
jgi:hypothetical protein